MFCVPRGVKVFNNLFGRNKNNFIVAVGYFKFTFTIILIVSDKCLCDSNNLPPRTFFNSVPIEDSSTVRFAKHSIENVTLETYSGKTDLNMVVINDSALDQDFQENFLIAKNQGQKSKFSHLRSSQLDNLIELLSQHSSEANLNNDNNNETGMNKHADIINSLDTFDSRKAGSKISEQYYDILYDFGLELNTDDPDHIILSSCESISNSSMSHEAFLLNNKRNVKNKQ
jgi:hypothetical protein